MIALSAYTHWQFALAVDELYRLVMKRAGARGWIQLFAGVLARITGGNAVRVAGIDCGTNSIRLLITDISADGGQVTDVAGWMLPG